MPPFRGTGQAFKTRNRGLNRLKPPGALIAQGASHARSSPVPYLVLTPAAVKAARTLLGQWPKRMRVGRRLFLLAAAQALREEVQNRAPELGGLPYAQSLEIALLDGTDAGEGVAIFFAGDATPLLAAQADRTLLWVVPKRGAPPAVEVLAQYSPWPSSLLPFRPEGGATLVARASRLDEVAYYTAAITRQRAAITRALRAAGEAQAEVAPPGTGEGATVVPDLGWAVLRAEFGLGGDGARPHWRPALAALWARIPALLRQFQRYVETGSRGAWKSLPADAGTGTTEGDDPGGFTRRIAPFAPRRGFR
jgi:hypothetical protein